MNQIEFQILPEAQTILVDGLPISTEYDIGYPDLVASAIGPGESFILSLAVVASPVAPVWTNQSWCGIPP